MALKSASSTHVRPGMESERSGRISWISGEELSTVLGNVKSMETE